ncbi:MAG: alpha/beta fold hydrolase [Thermodesulfobacteriota bacterium]|nr:alpha/beta fold hydrolase [Thermodesulfobacteriota bacterium]
MKEAMGRSMWNVCLTLTVMLSAVYFCIIVILFVLQSHLLYFPVKGLGSTPDDIGLKYKRVSLKTSDRENLSAWFIPARPAKGVIFFCHGNGGNISHRLESILIFHRLGFSTFIFDYRGYGLSSGSPFEAGTYLDAEAAWQYLVGEKQIAPSEIVVFGRSLGGAVAARLASRHSPRGLILESSFTSVPDLASSLYPWYPVRLLCRFKYDTCAELRQKNVPCWLFTVPKTRLSLMIMAVVFLKKPENPKSF